jgi:hypothetical protein
MPDLRFSRRWLWTELWHVTPCSVVLRRFGETYSLRHQDRKWLLTCDRNMFRYHGYVLNVIITLRVEDLWKEIDLDSNPCI